MSSDMSSGAMASSDAMASSGTMAKEPTKKGKMKHKRSPGSMNKEGTSESGQ